MAAGVVPFDPERIHGMRFSGACMDGWAERLLPLPPEERAARHPGLSSDRAPVLPAGLLILSEILRMLDAPEATVTTRGLRHGLCLRILSGELQPAWSW
jgi:exopolyphosphatase/pppGpp-phosphohydrolase